MNLHFGGRLYAQHLIKTECTLKLMFRLFSNDNVIKSN